MLFKALRPAPVSTAVQAEQVRLMFGQGVAVQFLGALTGVVAVTLFWEVADHGLLLAWTAAHLTLSLIRLIVSIRFARKKLTDEAIIQRWGPLYVGLAGLSGIVWGVLSLAYQPSWPSHQVVVLFAVYTGIIAGAFNTHTPCFVAFPTFYLPTIAFLSFSLLRHPGEGTHQLALLLMVYGVVMYVSALRYHNHLAHSLEIRFENERLARELTESNERLSHLAEIDALTGIANRRSMDGYLETEWKRHCRYRHPLSLLFIDVDYFKQYNDTYGHEAGDRCLARVASLLTAHAQRAGELVARFGGEEFAVILPETDADHALAMAETIRSAVEDERIVHAGSGIGDFLTVSIGISTVVPEQNRRLDELRITADRALYQAKAAGRNCIRFASETLDRPDDSEGCRICDNCPDNAPANIGYCTDLTG